MGGETAATTSALQATNANAGLWYCKVTDTSGTTYSPVIEVTSNGHKPREAAQRRLMASFRTDSKVQLAHAMGMDYVQPYDAARTYRVTTAAREHGKLRSSAAASATDGRSEEFGSRISTIVHLNSNAGDYTESAEFSVTRHRSVGTRITSSGSLALTYGPTKHSQKRSTALPPFKQDLVNATATAKQFNFTTSTHKNFGAAPATGDSKRYQSTFQHGELERDLPFTLSVNDTAGNITVTPQGLFRTLLSDHKQAGRAAPTFKITTQRMRLDNSLGAAEPTVVSTSFTGDYEAAKTFATTNLATERLAAGNNNTQTQTGTGSRVRMVYGGKDYKVGNIITINGGTGNTGIVVKRVHPQTGAILDVEGAWEFDSFTGYEGFAAGVHATTSTNGNTATSSGSGALFEVAARAHLAEHTATITIDGNVTRSVKFRFCPRVLNAAGDANAQDNSIEYTAVDASTQSQDVDRFLCRPHTNPGFTAHTENYVQASTDVVAHSVAAAHLQTDGLAVPTYSFVTNAGGITPASNGDFNQSLSQTISTRGGNLLYDLTKAGAAWAAAPYANTATLKMNVGTDIGVRFNVAQSDSYYTDTFQTANVFSSGTDTRVVSDLSDCTKNGHLIYANGAHLSAGDDFADFTKQGSGDVGVIYNTAHITAAALGVNGNNLRFATMSNVDEVVGRTPILLAHTDPARDGPSGLARSRDAIYLGVYPAHQFATKNHRFTPAAIKDKGSNYKAGDTLSANTFVLTVTEVDSDGGVLSFSVQNVGSAVTKDDIATDAAKATTTNGAGAGATVQVTEVYNDKLITDLTPDDRFADINHTTTRVLNDSVSNTLHPFAISAQTTVFTEGRQTGANAGKPQSDLFLTMSATSGYKLLGPWSGDGLKGRPHTTDADYKTELTMSALDTFTALTASAGLVVGTSQTLATVNANIQIGMGVTHANIPATTYVTAISGTGLTLSNPVTAAAGDSAQTLTFVPNFRELTVEFKDQTTKDSSTTTTEDMIKEETITANSADMQLASDLRTISRSGEGAFWVQDGRRISGRGANSTNSPNTISFADECTNVIRAFSFEVTANSLLMDSAGAGYTAGDLLKWNDAIIRVDTASSGGAITGWTLLRERTRAPYAAAGTAASGGSGTNAAFKIKANTTAKAYKIILPGLGFKSGSAPTTLTDAGTSTGVKLAFNNYSSKKTTSDDTDIAQRTHAGTSTFSVERVPAIATSLKIADTGDKHLPTLSNQGGVLNDTTKRFYATCQKLWSANASIFAGGFYANGQWSKNATSFAITETTGNTCKNLLRAKAGTGATDIATGLSLSLVRENGLKSTRGFGLIVGPGKAKLAVAANVATVNTAAVHNLKAGDVVVVTCATNSAYHAIAKVTSPASVSDTSTTFTYAFTAANTEANLVVDVRSQKPFARATSKDSAKIELLPNGYTGTGGGSVKQTGTQMAATELIITKGGSANRGLDLVDQGTDAAEDLAFVDADGSWQVAVTDALLSTNVTGKDAAAYDFESYKALTLGANRGNGVQGGRRDLDRQPAGQRHVGQPPRTRRWAIDSSATILTIIDGGLAVGNVPASPAQGKTTDPEVGSLVQADANGGPIAFSGFGGALLNIPSGTRVTKVEAATISGQAVFNVTVDKTITVQSGLAADYQTVDFQGLIFGSPFVTATVEVTAVSSDLLGAGNTSLTGPVSSFKLVNAGRGYATGDNRASTGGGSNNCNFNLNRVTLAGSLLREFETEYRAVTSNTITATAKATTANGSPVITLTSVHPYITPSATTVTGAGIPTGTAVSSIDGTDKRLITLDKNATATASDVTLTFTINTNATTSIATEEWYVSNPAGTTVITSTSVPSLLSATPYRWEASAGELSYYNEKTGGAARMWHVRKPSLNRTGRALAGYVDRVMDFPSGGISGIVQGDLVTATQGGNSVVPVGTTVALIVSDNAGEYIVLSQAHTATQNQANISVTFKPNMGSTIRSANPVQAIVKGYTRPLVRDASGTYSQRRVGSEDSDIYMLPGSGKAVNEVRFADDSEVFPKAGTTGDDRTITAVATAGSVATVAVASAHSLASAATHTIGTAMEAAAAASYSPFIGNVVTQGTQASGTLLGLGDAAGNNLSTKFRITVTSGTFLSTQPITVFSGCEAKLVLTLPESARPRYSTLKKPELTTAATVSKQGVANQNENTTDLNTFATTNCDEMLLFTNREDIGGSGANDRATAFEDRASFPLNMDGTLTTYSEGTAASTNKWRRFEADIDATGANASVGLSVRTKGNARFFKLDRAGIRYDQAGKVTIASNVATATYKITKAACNITAGSTTVTVPNTQGIGVGAIVSHASIRTDTTVAEITDNTTIKLSANAVGTTSNTSIDFGHGLNRDERVGDYINVQFYAGNNTQTSGSKQIASIATNGFDLTYATTDADAASINAEISLGAATETQRELRVLGATSGSLVSALAVRRTSTDTAAVHNSHIFRMKFSDADQPMDVHNIGNATVSTNPVGGQHGNGQTDAHRRFPAASGVLGSKIQSKITFTCNLTDKSPTIGGTVTQSSNTGTVLSFTNTTLVVLSTSEDFAADGNLSVEGVVGLVGCTAKSTTPRCKLAVVSGVNYSGYETLNGGAHSLRTFDGKPTGMAVTITAMSAGVATFSTPTGTPNDDFVVGINYRLGGLLLEGSAVTGAGNKIPVVDGNSTWTRQIIGISPTSLTALANTEVTQGNAKGKIRTGNPVSGNTTQITIEVTNGTFVTGQPLFIGGPLVDVDGIVRASRGMPQNDAQLIMCATGTGYAAGDILFVNNHDTASIGKDRIKITVNSVDGSGGITGHTAAFPGSYDHADTGTASSAEPVYKLKVNLSTSTMVGEGTGACFKFEAEPSFTISARQQHPFYIYSEMVNSINLLILLSLSLTITDMASVARARKGLVRTGGKGSDGAYRLAAANEGIGLGSQSLSRLTGYTLVNAITNGEADTTLTLAGATDITPVFKPGQRILVGSGTNMEVMLVVSNTDANGVASNTSITVLRGPDAERIKSSGRTERRGHLSGTEVTLDSSQFYTQGDGRIRYTEPALTGDFKQNQVFVIAGAGATKKIGDTYTVLAPQSLRDQFRSEWNTAKTNRAASQVTHVVWNAETSSATDLPTVMGLVTARSTQSVNSATYDKYTVRLTTTSRGTITFATGGNGTRGTLLEVDGASGDTHHLDRPSKLHHLTPMSREVHLSELQLTTASSSTFGAAGNGTGPAEPDDLTNEYPSNRFDIHAFVVRRTSALPIAANITWQRVTSAGGTLNDSTVSMTLPTSAVSATASADCTKVYDGSSSANAGTGKNLSAASVDIQLVPANDVSQNKYLLVFGVDQKLSGYYELTSADANGTVAFKALAANWDNGRLEQVDQNLNITTTSGVDRATVVFSSQTIFIMRAWNCGSDWTYPDTTNANMLRQKSVPARPNTATLFTDAAPLLNPTFLGSQGVAMQAEDDATSFGKKMDSSSEQTLVNYRQQTVLHSNGTANGGAGSSGLGTINMMTDERRIYKIMSKTDLSRFAFDRFKLIDLPTRIDMRDVIVTVVRPAVRSNFKDTGRNPTLEEHQKGDIIVMSQLSDMTHMVADRTDGNYVRFLNPYVSSACQPVRPEMSMTKRDKSVATLENSHTIDEMLRGRDRSVPLGLHPHAYATKDRTLNYTMKCSAAFGDGADDDEPGRSGLTIVLGRASVSEAYGTVAANDTIIRARWRTGSSDVASGLQSGDAVSLSSIDHVAPHGSTTHNQNTAELTQIRHDGTLAQDPTNTVELVFGADITAPTTGSEVTQAAGVRTGTIVSYEYNADTNNYKLTIDTSDAFVANAAISYNGGNANATPSAASVVGIMFDITLDAAVSAATASTMNQGKQFFLTPTSRVRRILAPTTDSQRLNGLDPDDLMGAFAVMMPGWGFRNDGQDGVDAMEHSMRSTVREGNFVAGLNDSNMREQIFVANNTQVGLKLPSHIDLTAAGADNSRAHPFGVSNVMNNIPEFDVYER